MDNKLSKSLAASALAGVFVVSSGSVALASTGGNNPTDEGLQEMLDALGDDGGAESGAGGDTGADDNGSVAVDDFYEAETDHIRIESEQTTYPLAPTETGFWFVDINSITGEEATAYADLEVSGDFEAEISVYDNVRDEMVFSDSNANISDGGFELDEFALTDGVEYVIAVQAADDAPQFADLGLDLTVSAMGETVEVPPDVPEETPTPTPDDPDTPDDSTVTPTPVPEDPETPDRPDRPVPPVFDAPETPEVPEYEDEREEQEAAPVEDYEDPDNPIIESGYTGGGTILWASLFSMFAGVLLVVAGSMRFFRSKQATDAAGGGN